MAKAQGIFDLSNLPGILPFLFDSFLIRNSNTILYHLVIQLSVSWKSDALLLYGCIYTNFLYCLFEFFLREQMNAFLSDTLHPLFTNTFAEVDKVGRIKLCIILKTNLPNKMLPLRIFKSTCDDAFITLNIGLLQY